MNIAFKRTSFLAYILIINIFSISDVVADDQEYQYRNREIAVPSDIHVVMTDELGLLYTDHKGKALYTWTGDNSPYQSNCNNATYHGQIIGQGDNPTFLPDRLVRPTCEEVWRPLKASQVHQTVGPWTTITRYDGTNQWAHNGKPVYTYSYDSPGAITGIGGHFHGGNLTERFPLFAPSDTPPGFGTTTNQYGYVLTDTSGNMLYSLIPEYELSNACSSKLKSIGAPEIRHFSDSSEFSVIPGSHGHPQWAFKGEPLYSKTEVSNSDSDLCEDGPEFLKPVILKERVETPSDISIVDSQEGEVFANSEGMTLYTFYCWDESPDNLPCNEPGTAKQYRLAICGGPQLCARTWIPVIAPPDAKPIGNVWTVVEIDGTGEYLFPPSGIEKPKVSVWAYYGRPVFSYSGDKFPGDIRGHGIRSLRHWGFFMLKRNSFYGY